MAGKKTSRTGGHTAKMGMAAAGLSIGSSFPLTKLEADFVYEFCLCRDAEKAMLAAGYRDNPETSKSRANKILKRPRVLAAIKEQFQAAAKVKSFSVEKAVAIIISSAQCDIRDFNHPDGRVKQLHELTYEQQFLIAGWDVGEDGRVKKYHFADRRKNLRTFLEYHGALTQKIQLTEEKRLTVSFHVDMTNFSAEELRNLHELSLKAGVPIGATAQPRIADGSP